MNQLSVCHHRQRHHRRRDASHGLIFGGLLVLAGVVFLLDQAALLGPFRAWQFWPLIIVVHGVGHLVRGGVSGGRALGLLLTAVGGLLLLHTLAVVAVPWQLIWPAALVAVGVYLIWTMAAHRRQPLPTPGSLGSVTGSVIMGEQRDLCSLDAFEGGRVFAMMGSYELDLSGARMKGDQAHLVARAVMGEVKVRVPDDWQVSLHGFPILGAVEDKTRARSDDGGQQPILVIHASAILGSVEIER